MSIDLEKEKTCAFTGHRVLKADFDEKLLKSVINQIVAGYIPPYHSFDFHNPCISVHKGFPYHLQSFIVGGVISSVCVSNGVKFTPDTIEFINAPISVFVDNFTRPTKL